MEICRVRGGGSKSKRIFHWEEWKIICSFVYNDRKDDYTNNEYFKFKNFSFKYLLEDVERPKFRH